MTHNTRKRRRIDATIWAAVWALVFVLVLVAAVG